MSNANESKKSNSGLMMVALLLAVVLVGSGLFLLRDQFFGGDAATDNADSVVTEAVVENDAVSAETDTTAASMIDGKIAIQSASPVAVKELSGSEFGQQLPANTELQGSVYTLSYEGDAPSGVATLNMPSGADERLIDMYGWDGGGWTFIPATTSGEEVVSAETELPQAIALIKNNDPEQSIFGAEVLPMGQVPGAVFPVLSEVSVGTLTLGAEGEILGDPVLIQPGSYNEYLRVTNTGFVVDTGSLLTLLGSPEFQTKHIDGLVSRVLEGAFAGINVDYQGVPAAQSDAFADFLMRLDNALAQENRLMVVTLANPELVNGQWQTEGHDWQAIGNTADAVLMQMPLDPLAYGDNGLAEQMIAWAIDQVDRQKLSLFLSANAIDQVGDGFVELSGNLALANFGELQVLQGAPEMSLGDIIEVGLSGSASPLAWDGGGVTYKYTFEQSGQTHTVWLANEAALAHRMRLADRYNLRGAMVRGLGELSDGSGYMAAYNSIDGSERPEAQAAALVWTVVSESGDVVASDTGADKFSFAYQNNDTPGNYALNIDFALGDNQSRLGSVPFVISDPAVVEEAEAVAEAEAEEAPAEEGEAEAASDDATADESAAAETASTGSAIATDSNAVGRGTTTIDTNFRQGPGFYYAVDTILATSTVLNIYGRDSSGQWVNAAPVDSTETGWVFSQLVRLDGITLGDMPVLATSAVASVPVAQPTAPPVEQPVAQPVAQVPQPQQTIWPTRTPAPIWPTSTPAPQGVWPGTQPQPQPTAVPPQAQPTAVPPTAVPAPTEVPAPAAPAPVVLTGGFELGGQTHHFTNPSLMSDIGMNWVKFQHKWGSGDTADAVADRVRNAKASGFKVLLSMPGQQTYPTSIDFAGYVNFLRGVAALNPPPDAIEVWNEMNIDFEWPAGQISPSDYVNQMLKPAYQAIKASNPNVIVISGAPAPTGFDNGTNAWADDRYMAGVAAAGGANFMDCVGVHYNAGATAPSQDSGHPADGGARHYSWYFFPTMNMYYNAFGGSRQVCFTEVGFLSTQDYGSTPPAFHWAANTSVDEHATWLADAVQLSASSGKTRMMIIFNVDFTYFDPSGDPQAGYALIRPNGSCPACPLIKSVMGR